MKRIVVLLLLLILSFSSCNIFSPPADDAFAIYLLKDKTLSVYNNLGDDYLSKPLDPTPLLAANDIEYYDWSSHCIYLKTNKQAIRERLLDSTGFLFNLPGAPFVVTASGQTDYYGFLYSMIMSLAPTEPTIDDMSLRFYPEDVFVIRESWNTDEPDARDNAHVKQALIEAGLYRGGIELEFDTDYGLHFSSVDSIDWELEYRYTITNNDNSDLYILDPDKAGDTVYFYFNNMPSFNDLVFGERCSWDNPFIDAAVFPDTSDFDNLDWYTLLAPGTSMTRTLRKNGYQNVYAGEYIFRLSYNTPIHTMSKEKRTKPQGDIWIGKTSGPVQIYNYLPE